MGVKKSVILSKDSQIKQFTFILIALFLVSILVIANSPPIIESITLEVDGETKEEIFLNNPKLAEITIPPSYDKNYTKQYLEYFNYFKDINSTKISNDKEDVLKSGNVRKELRAYEINGKDYVIDLAACDRILGHCIFLINGVPTGAMYPKNDKRHNSFSLNNDYELVIENVIYDYCDDQKKACNIEYRAYDIVRFKVRKK